MPRNMSFAHTKSQILDRTKTVTRRRRWFNLTPGERFWAVEKLQGLKKGDHIMRLALCECVSNLNEQLMEIDKHPGDVAKEGFPGMSVLEFIRLFARIHRGSDAYS